VQRKINELSDAIALLSFSRFKIRFPTFEIQQL